MKKCLDCNATYSDDYDSPVCEKCSGEIDVVEENSGGKKQIANNKLIIAIIVVAVIVVGLFAFIFIGLNKDDTPETTTLPPEESTLAEVITTNPAEKYAPGKYTVNAGAGQTLNFRKSFEKDSELYSEAIPNGKELIITEIKYIPSADEVFRYMGKTTYPVNYENCEGWVAMYYLADAYSSSIVTPGELTTTAPEDTTVAAPENTTVATPENTTVAAPENTTASSTASTEKPTTVGTYTIDVDPNPGNLRMRADHSVDSENITLIPAGTKVTVTDVYEDANSSDQTLKYWGKVTYAGYTGWISMWYLK